MQEIGKALFGAGRKRLGMWEQSECRQSRTKPVNGAIRYGVNTP